MITGKVLRLNAGTLAVEYSETDRPSAVTMIPAGEVIEVISQADGNGILDVLFNGRMLSVSEVDLEARGEQLAERAAAG